MALIVTTWCWGDKYDDSYVQKLADGVHRNLTEAHRFICFTDRERRLGAGIEQWPLKVEDYHLTQVKGCFVRLRLFDPEFQATLGVKPGDRIVNLDIDMVVTGELDGLFNRPEPFVVFGGANAANPCPYNGSVFMLRAGYRPDVWSSFSLDAASKIRRHEFPDDQGWFWEKMPDAAIWKAGAESGVYGFEKPGWPVKTTNLPVGAKLVGFFGWRDPSKFVHLGWVKDNWR